MYNPVYSIFFKLVFFIYLAKFRKIASLQNLYKKNSSSLGQKYDLGSIHMFNGMCCTILFCQFWGSCKCLFCSWFLVDSVNVCGKKC